MIYYWWQQGAPVTTGGEPYMTSFPSIYHRQPYKVTFLVSRMRSSKNNRVAVTYDQLKHRSYLTMKTSVNYFLLAVAVALKVFEVCCCWCRVSESTLESKTIQFASKKGLKSCILVEKVFYGPYFDLIVKHFVCVSVSLTVTATRLYQFIVIVMKFGINILGKSHKWRICKVFY